jgi:hypothetical protein
LPEPVGVRAQGIPGENIVSAIAVEIADGRSSPPADSRAERMTTAEKGAVRLP